MWASNERKSKEEATMNLENISTPSNSTVEEDLSLGGLHELGMLRLKLLEDPNRRDTAARRKRRVKKRVSYDFEGESGTSARAHPFSCRPPWFDLRKKEERWSNQSRHRRKGSRTRTKRSSSLTAQDRQLLLRWPSQRPVDR